MSDRVRIDIIELDRELTESAYEQFTEGTLSRDRFNEITGKLRQWSELGHNITNILDARAQ